MPKIMKRCPWVPEGDELYTEYHDSEWGVPVRDERKLFEFLVLEAFQAGLSWKCVLYKRENFRRHFANFDYEKVARFGAKEIREMLKDPGIIRNRAKCVAAIENAKCFIQIRKEFGSFSEYMWNWVGGKPKINRFKTLKDYLPYSEEALAWSKDLKKRGFKFLGPTVVYSHMQAVGMVNDHVTDCFRYRELIK